MTVSGARYSSHPVDRGPTHSWYAMRTFNGTARRGDGHSYVGRFVPISPAETADLDEEGIVLRD
jgi:hypothetical protein